MARHAETTRWFWLLTVPIAGCMGTLRTPDGADRVRGALWFEDPLQFAGAHRAVVLVTNSRLPCVTDDVEDDPDTVEDEAAAAEVYWRGEVVSAFTREGTVVVGMALYTRQSSWDGDYSVDASAWTGAEELLIYESGVGAAAWYEVQEAALVGSDGLFYQYTPTLLQYDEAVDAPGSIEVTEEGSALDGSFTFTTSNVSGRFRAERCDNEDLYNQALAILQALPFQSPLTSR